LRGREALSDLILRSGVFAASRRMAASLCVAAILRDARKSALLRIRSENFAGSQDNVEPVEPI
jgi:hypothetical protein